MKKFLLLCFAFVFAAGVALAQDRVVSGRVTSTEDGSSLPGVNVVLKGTTNGTVTDSDGNYKLNVPASGGSLVFSFIGLQTQEAAIGERTTVDITLGLDVTQLTEVVVTAQGIEREQKAIGFAQTTISSQLLANKPETDVGRALQGRTPGLQMLASSGLAGSGAKINIRGSSSITGNTQPLWIVNGVPINTDQNDISSDFQDGKVSPTRYLDIDPNNIESISVLRGLNATTLYGSQGRNGVIIVTTKTGSNKGVGKFDGSITQSYFVNEAVVPQFQNKWANGFDGAYGEFFSNWGPLFNGKPTQADHPFYPYRNIFPQFPEFATSKTTVLPGQTVAGYIPQAYPNNVKDFFRKGSSQTTSMSLSTRTENGSMSFSYSHLDEKGFIKYNDLKRDNFSLGASQKLTSKLSFQGAFNFARTDFATPPAAAGQGSNTSGAPSVFANVFYTPRNIDLMGWPYENPADHSMTYYRNDNGITNPRWLLENARQTNLTNRFFSSQSLNYKFTDWINVTYRLGFDTYNERQSYWNNKGGGAGFDSHLTPGALRTVSDNSTVLDHTLMASIAKEFNENWSLNGVVGANYRSNKYQQTGLESLGQVVYGFLEHRNYTSTLPRDWRGAQLNYVRNSAIGGIYGAFDISYKQMLYVNLSARNDWSTNMQRANYSQLYPGASVAFIPTAAFPNMASEVLDFLKIRAAVGSSANFGNPYSTSPTLSLDAQSRVDGSAAGTVVTSRLSSLLANPNLQPEKLTEYEVGVEANLFENRITLNASYYDKISKNQILYRSLDPSSGYTGTYINAGTITNKGIEAALTVVPVKTENLSWSLTANFTRNRSMVVKLPEGSKELVYAGFSNLGNFAIEGQPLGVIKASYTERSPDGQLIINSAGSYKQADEIGIIANPNPNWLGSVISNLTWKSVTFGMQWDYVSGGQILSYTAATMVGRGVAKDLENFDPTLPLILPGVLEVTDETGKVTGYKPNNIPLTTAGVFFGNTIIGGAPYDRGIYDATRVRFREVSLAYSLPQSFVSKLKLRSVTIVAQGNNLWFRAINAPKYARADFDRTAFGSGNGSGFDYLGGPSARRYGATLKVNF
jgi:TonB-linked SusC/RagA family outer membrane protein